MNPIAEYVRRIDAGQEVVSRRVAAVYRRLLRDLEEGRWRYDAERAARPIEFLERFCRQSKGAWMGRPLELLPFQRAYLAALFGVVGEDGTRRFRESLLLMGRKNGKSTLLAGLLLYMLVADGEGGAECYCAASKRDQARIIFAEALAMVEQSEVLRRHLRKRKGDIYYPLKFGRLEALSREASSMDGLNAHCVVIDELHAIRNRELYEVLRQSMSARRQPLLVMISTAGMVRENIYDEMYGYASRVADGAVDDPRFWPVLYELDSAEEWTDCEAWHKANPGLGVIKRVDDLADKVSRARENPRELPGVLCKEFNVRAQPAASWLTWDEVYSDATYELADHRGVYAVGGIDLSSTTDLTCATLLWVRDGIYYVAQQYFLPAETAARREREDRVPYGTWAAQGWVTLTDGARVDYAEVARWYQAMRDANGIYPLWIGYDTWGAGYLVQEMEAAGFVLEPVPQGARTMSAPMKDLQARLMEHRVNYNANPVLLWNLTNVEVRSDDNGNLRPVKGRNPKRRIDGAVSLIDAWVVLMRHWDDYANLA